MNRRTMCIEGRLKFLAGKGFPRATAFCNRALPESRRKKKEKNSTERWLYGL